MSSSHVTPLFVAGSLALSIVVFGFAKWYFTDRKERKTSLETDHLLVLLQKIDEDKIDKEDLVIALNKLVEVSAFVQIQIRIHDLGYLDKIANIVNYPDYEVKQAAVLLINNLSLNEANQAVLTNHIPMYLAILKGTELNENTATLFLGVLKALTNLTTLDRSHNNMLPHITTLCEILQECEVIQIKIQVLRVLVNISTNSKICENLLELDAQLLSAVESFINPEEDERCLLRAASCCANILAALHRRWQHGKKTFIATPEFVSDSLRENLVQLSTHPNQDIQFQARRSLISLKAPTMTESHQSTVDDMDILDVLKI